jgi:hypothetical protein
VNTCFVVPANHLEKSPLTDAAVLDSPELSPLGGCNISDTPILGSCGTGSLRCVPVTMSAIDGPVC